MNRTRTLLAAALVAGAALTACTSPGAGAAPAETTARPVLDQPVYLGPGQAAADRQLLDAVRGLTPWLVTR